MKRTPLAPRRTRLAPVSSKRRREATQRRQVIDAALERDGGCVLRGNAWSVLDGIDLGCCAGPLDCHEVIPRSAWPGGHLVLANTKTLCRKHHELVSAEPAWAHRQGLHGYSYERPS